MNLNLVVNAFLGIKLDSILSSSFQLNEWVITIFSVLGGLGLFLYGISLMGDTLKAIAGNRMKSIIEKTTNTPLKGVFVGFIVTALIQSSSGTTALTVGLVRAGLMTLPQAVGVIMGANIGSTVTSFMVGLNVAEFGLPIMFVGAFLVFFFSKNKVKNIGLVILGFGMLFYGLDLMGSGLEKITELQSVKDLLESLGSNPILGLLIGTLLTALIQSSAATIAIVQELFAAGSIQLLGALPILIGSNIGTTITAVIAALGGSTPAKRTACVHVVFNIIGALLFMAILYPVYEPIMRLIDSGLGGQSKMTISVAHIIFNVLSTTILFFFIKQLVWIANKFIPGNESDAALFDQELLKESLIDESPTIALEFVKRAIDHMGHDVMRFFEITTNYSFAENSKERQEADEIENMIDSYNETIHKYLIKIAKNDITDEESQILSKYLDTIRDLERIGDHCMNIFEFFQERYDANQVLSPGGDHDLHKMYNVLSKMINISLKSLQEDDKESATFVAALEDEVDALEEKYRKRHIVRLNTGECHVSDVDNFVDILSNLERIGDHCNNIAGSVISEVYYEEDDMDDAYVQGVKKA